MIERVEREREAIEAQERKRCKSERNTGATKTQERDGHRSESH